MIIESVVEKRSEKASKSVHDATCSACEMAVVWIQSQLKKNISEDRIIDYANQVSNFLNFLHFSLLPPSNLILNCAHAALRETT